MPGNGDVENGKSTVTSTTTTNTTTNTLKNDDDNIAKDDYVSFQMNICRYKARYDDKGSRKSQLIYLQLIIFDRVIVTFSSGTLD